MRTRMLWRVAQELINKIVLVVGCVTLIDRRVKFIFYGIRVAWGIDKID